MLARALAALGAALRWAAAAARPQSTRALSWEWLWRNTDARVKFAS